MPYNETNKTGKSGITYYIDELNTRFNSLLYTTNIRNIAGLARIDIEGVPFIRSGNQYTDALFNDKNDLSLFYVESGDRKINGYSFDAKIDLIVTAKMTNFTGIEEEDIIEQVYEIMKVTSFEPIALARDTNAYKEFKYSDKITETMRPYFVFRIKCKLNGQLKQ